MKTKERIKTILLVVLLFGSVFLSYLVWTNYTGNVGGSGAQSITTGTTTARQSGATPFAITYKTDAGRYGAAYHGGSVKSVYDKVSPTIATALNDDLRRVNESTWSDALSLKGILVDYEGNLPLFMIGKDLGISDKMPEVYCRYLLMTEDYIYIKDKNKLLDVLLTASKCFLESQKKQKKRFTIDIH